jgi:hypothetical protein
MKSLSHCRHTKDIVVYPHWAKEKDLRERSLRRLSHEGHLRLRFLNADFGQPTAQEKKINAPPPHSNAAIPKTKIPNNSE